MFTSFQHCINKQNAINVQRSGKLWLFICCKTKLEKKFFFGKIFVFLQNIHYLQKKIFLYGKKSFIIKNLFLLEKTFFTEKNYISFPKYIFTQKIFVLQIKYESFLNTYSFCKKKFV